MLAASEDRRGRVLPVSDLVAIRDRARFTGPTMRSGVVERARLDDRYASATGQVLRVLAPAGYGKSTQVLRWVVDDQRRVRWLDLEPIDNDPLVPPTRSPMDSPIDHGAMSISAPMGDLSWPSRPPSVATVA